MSGASLDQELWTKVRDFDFDYPLSEYGFSLRLAAENYWSQNYAKRALLEYKKFMYLAATSDLMVSPSEPVDIVWHQHLVFTQSYTDFCSVLGKQIQHVPSTHNREDRDKFLKAKERTTKLYEQIFGEQPDDIWHHAGVFDSLHLEKAGIKTRTFIIIGLMVFAVMIIPAYMALSPLYKNIYGMNFIFAYAPLFVVALVLLHFYNKSYLRRLVMKMRPSAAIFHLHPMEVLYLESGRLPEVVHGTVNQMVLEEKLSIASGGQLVPTEGWQPRTYEEHQVLAVQSLGTPNYAALVKILVEKPVFKNIAVTMGALRKYITKSKKFATLFYTNFIIIAVLGMLGVVRLIMAFMNDKPAGALVFIMVCLALVTSVFFYNLADGPMRSIVPELYRKYLAPAREDVKNWDWQYFLIGATLFAPAFTPLANEVDKLQSSSDSSDSSGSSCGSSCSSCGGCGGD